MAFRIKEDGGILQVRLNPLSPNSSFKHPDFLGFLLKVNRYDIRIIKLNDGDKMVVRSESFSVKTEEKFNAAATKYLHEHSNQKTAIIFGPAIVINKKDWNA